MYKRQRGQFRSELHERFSSPLYPLVFVLIAVASVGQARSTRQNRVEAVVTGFVLAAMCRLGGLAINNLVALRASMVPALYLMPIIVMGLSMLMIARNARPRGGPSLIDRGMGVLSRLTAALRLPLFGRRSRVTAGG
jgi:lipopolysaccharide export system permease protein